MKLVYFAWVRERVGLREEEVAPPSDVLTVADLLAWLKERGDNYDAALVEPRVLRVALDKKHARHDAPIGGASEIAIFPPMTGG